MATCLWPELVVKTNDEKEKMLIQFLIIQVAPSVLPLPRGVGGEGLM